MNKKMVIAGGTGLIGKALTTYFAKEGYHVSVLTRSASQVLEGIHYVNWDGKSNGRWAEVFNDIEVLINLSGKSIDCRFTEKNKKLLLESRIQSTKVLAVVIEKLENPPKLWLNASAGAMYKSKVDANTEEETEFDNSFLGKMATLWEKEFFDKKLPKTRRAAMRISLVLDKQGGVYPILRRLTRMYLGGTLGSGNQKVSCIHMYDLIKAVDFIIGNSTISGPVNFSINVPVTNKEFMKKLRRSLGVSVGIPAPEWGIKFFSFFLRKEPSLLLDDTNFIPLKLQHAGYQFEFDQVDKIFNDLK